MTAELRAPLAIRITRPYSTEDEYLEHELDTLTRASITLVGAQPRAEGVVLRFELVLVSGQVLLRGEGRVTGFKPNALQGQGGLALRFTRLDTRSKALVDKAASLRERRRPSYRSPGSDPPPMQSIAAHFPSMAGVPPPELALGSKSQPPLRPASSSMAGIPSPEPALPPLPRSMAGVPPVPLVELPLPSLPRSMAAAPPSEPLLPPLLPSTAGAPVAYPLIGGASRRPSPAPLAPGPIAERGAAASSAPPPPSGGGIGRQARATPLPVGSSTFSDPMARPPQDREALLERLRARAKTLDPAMVRRLLGSRGSS